MKFLTTALFILSTTPAFARMGPITSGGGDDIALEFTQAFDRAYKTIQSSDPALAAQLAAANLEDVVEHASIYTVDQTLKVPFGSMEQESVATNTPASGFILINRFRWQKIRQPHIKEAIALHEVASLKGIESTGHYPVSSAYLARFSLSEDPAVLLMGQDPQADSSLMIQRTSCESNQVLEQVKTGKKASQQTTSLQTSSSWAVHGKNYLLNYYYQSSTPGQPAPVLAQVVLVDHAQAGGVVSASDSKILMLTESTGKVEDFAFHKENFKQVGENGEATMSTWVNGAKGAPMVQASQKVQPDGSVVMTSRTLDKQIYSGVRDGGSTDTCTTRSLSRDAWFALVSDSQLAAEITKLDQLSFVVADADLKAKSCTPENCVAMQASVAQAEKNFVVGWQKLYADRKADFTKKYAAIRAKIAKANAAAAAHRPNPAPAPAQCEAYGSQHCLSPAEIGALDAIAAAKEQNYKDSVVRELKDIQDELDRRHH